MLTIKLSKMPADTPGIYPLIAGKPNRTQGGKLPERFRYLYPEAAVSLPEGLRFSDMYRSPLGSLHAIETKAGVKAPGFSGHNFGLSVDVDVDDWLATHKGGKAGLDGHMRGANWYCHRKDSLRGPEDWHYNWIPEERYLAGITHTTSHALEKLILDLYGKGFRMTGVEMQKALTALHYYDSDIDGIVGPRTKTAINHFCASWGCGPGTWERTLAVVSATIEVV